MSHPASSCCAAGSSADPPGLLSAPQSALQQNFPAQHAFLSIHRCLLPTQILQCKGTMRTLLIHHHPHCTSSSSCPLMSAPCAQILLEHTSSYCMASAEAPASATTASASISESSSCPSISRRCSFASAKSVCARPAADRGEVLCQQLHMALPLLQLCGCYVMYRHKKECVLSVLLLFHKARECSLLPQVGDSTQCSGQESHLDPSCRQLQALHRDSPPAVTRLAQVKCLLTKSSVSPRQDCKILGQPWV